MQTHLETERLILRRFTPDDVDLLVELDSDPEVMRYLNGGSPTPREVIEREALPRFLRFNDRANGVGYWAAIERASGSFLGRVFLRIMDLDHPEVLDLGYRLRQAAWGQGYATEASRALLRQVFADPGIQRITAAALAGNIASRRVMEKAGMTLVRRYRMTPARLATQDTIDVTSVDPWDGDDVEYALEKVDWERSRVKQDHAAAPPSPP